MFVMLEFYTRLSRTDLRSHRGRLEGAELILSQYVSDICQEFSSSCLIEASTINHIDSLIS